MIRDLAEHPSDKAIRDYVIRGIGGGRDGAMRHLDTCQPCCNRVAMAARVCAVVHTRASAEIMDEMVRVRQEHAARREALDA